MAEFCHLSQGIDVKLSVVRGYTERELNDEEIDLSVMKKPAATVKHKVQSVWVMFRNKLKYGSDQSACVWILFSANIAKTCERQSQWKISVGFIC